MVFVHSQVMPAWTVMAVTLTPKLPFVSPPQLPCLSSYDSYCSNQVAAKALLDHKKQDHRVQDFLQRCLESPFSRKLDLWNFLDIPRSRLVKYPLLLREILRHTPNDNPDQQHLEEAVSLPVSFSLPVSLSIMARVGSVGSVCMGPSNLGFQAWNYHRTLMCVWGGGAGELLFLTCFQFLTHKTTC